MKKRIYDELSTTQIIMVSFLAAILLGSVLLVLPISSADGEAIPYIDALFTATTSVCVTGLTTVPTALAWSVFGQIVILLLIQVGGLGVITIISAFMIDLHKKIGLGNRMLIQAAFNLNTLSGLVKFVKKVMLGTFVVEGIGACLYMTVFVPAYGVRGIWVSIFNSVSAFCNAGIDIVSEKGLCEYSFQPLINIVTGTLIILGSIGYIVWWDVMRVLTQRKRLGWKCFGRLTLHSKIAISVTAFLIIAGALAFFVFEYSNPLTMKEYSLWEKIQASCFQSITVRTARFAMIPQQNLTNASAIVSLLMMFIGGSPSGTAGGIKTVTMAVLVSCTAASIQNKNEVAIFHRNIPRETVSKAVAITTVSFATICLSTILLSAITVADALDVVYEAVSATATVGLSRNLTPSLGLWSKVVVIVSMYLGRIGPISLAIAFRIKKEKNNIISNPTEEIIVG